MKKTIITILTLFVSGWGFSQEIVTGLTENPVIKKAYQQRLEQKEHERSSVTKEWIPVTLPFFDDFSDYVGYPDTAIWLDDEAYINRDFPFRQANLGSATLDVIDAQGNIYSNASIYPFIADRLTSRPIRLDSVFYPIPEAIRPSDSVYFSFFYQPQGRGEPLNPSDSLILEFGHYGEDSVFTSVDSITVPLSAYITPNDTVFPGDTLFSPCDDTWGMAIFDTLYYGDEVTLPCDSVFFPNIKWTEVWGTPGMPLDTFYKNDSVYRKQVMIPITDSAKYLREDFFFRFFNYGSLPSIPSWKSNCDQWNIDYVYLNIGRSMGDTVYRTIGFVERSPSMLKNFERMPYDQYLHNPTNVLRDTFKLYITNLDNTTFNTIYKYRLTNDEGTFEKSYDGGSCNLLPFYEEQYQNCTTCPQHACPPWKFLFPLNYSSEFAKFRIDHILLGDITSADTLHDTLTFYQEFYNYFAYDDGTPEAGYGLVPAGAQLAYQFKLSRPDTLRGIKMFFNKVVNNANDMYFDLAVWADNNGIPGELIYIQENEKPRFTNDLYKMHTYELDSGVLVNNIFYIGWIQSENKNLNVGFDKYNDAREYTFYNSTGNWNQSLMKGAIMMRPLLGKEIIIGMHENKVRTQSVSLYPNPVHTGSINIDLEGIKVPEKAYIQIYNIFGQLVYESKYSETHNISHLKDGVYIFRLIQPENRKVYSAKFIVSG